jgi:beta-lysine 5,6-aminomutase alpha subunit
MDKIASLADEIEFRKDGIIVKRAHEVLDRTVAFLDEVEKKGLIDSIAEGLFADVKRPRDGGKGLDGLVEKGEAYWNPVEELLEARLGLGRRSGAGVAGATAAGVVAGSALGGGKGGL